MMNPIVDQRAEFSVSYEGPALTNNTMEVRDLAPALLALGRMFDRANVLLNGNDTEINLRIRAIRPGSFEIVLFLEQFLENATVVLGEDFLTSAADLVEVVVGGSVVGAGLITLMKRLRGKRPPAVDQQSDGILIEAEKLRITVPTEVIRLYRDRPMREQLEAVVQPLIKEGIDRLVVKRNNEELEAILDDEARYFDAEFEDFSEAEITIPRQRLQIVNLTFIEGRKWRLSDGATVNWYAMEDLEFAQSISHGKRFGKDDILICEVLLTQKIGETGSLNQEYYVKRVLRHVHPGDQLSFPESAMDRPET